jgi:broad specificity phosphatase PhoE
MSLLLFVRHGQATTRAFELGNYDGYDHLSPLGERQAHLLGQQWVKDQRCVDVAYVGPRRRHRQTHDVVARVFAEEGRAFPEPRVLPELDEFQADAFVRFARPSDETAPGFGIRYRDVIRQWVRGELRVNGVEEWPHFRERVRAGLEQIIADVGLGKTVAVFTSGGTLAATVGFVLRLDDERTLDLAWAVRHTALTELVLRERGAFLRAFNLVHHIPSPDLVTEI